MKKSSLFLFLLLLLINIKIYSQDTNIVKYLQLKVGNTWFYQYYGNPNSAVMKISITNSLIDNGHVYYVFSTTGSICGCAGGSYPPFLTGNSPMRVDSINGNVMFYGNSCQWQNNEHLLDSLKSRMGDPIHFSCNGSICNDTNSVNVFGILRKTKYMGLSLPNVSGLRRYAYGIGMISSQMNCYNSSCVYSLIGCVVDGVAYGDTTLVGINQISSVIPNNFSLSQNYPNPFNPGTNIKFQIAKSSNAKLVIYDALGKEVETLLDKKLEPGEYEAEFNATDLPSGVYYYKLVVGDNTNNGGFIESKKMVLIK